MHDVSKQIHSVLLIFRYGVEAVAGAEAQSADDAVHVVDVSFNAAVRRESGIFNMNDLQLGLRLDEYIALELVLVAEFCTDAVVGLPEIGSDIGSVAILSTVVVTDSADLCCEVSVASAVGQKRVIEVQSVAFVVAAAGETEQIGIGLCVVKGDTNDLAAPGR